MKKRVNVSVRKIAKTKPLRCSIGGSFVILKSKIITSLLAVPTTTNSRLMNMPSSEYLERYLDCHIQPLQKLYPELQKERRDWRPSYPMWQLSSTTYYLKNRKTKQEKKKMMAKKGDLIPATRNNEAVCVTIF